MICYEDLEKIFELRKLKPSRIAKEIGIPASTFSDWKSGRSMPKMDKLQKIADYLGISTEYLMTGHDPAETVRESPRESGLSDQERELLRRFVLLDQGDRGKLSAYLDGLLAADKYDKKELFA